MAVHFKFRSAVAFDSVPVEGNGITIANLKDKIVEQKNLGKSTQFDLVITNADSGEEYTEDTFLVPKNTSVIVKRVPARRGKTTLLVNEPEDDVMEQRLTPTNKPIDMAQLALTSPIDQLYDMDDFGVDLYAVDESALTHVEADEISNASAFLAKTTPEQTRFAQEISPVIHAHGIDAVSKGSVRGSSYRATPHEGYVCHRCGLPGHFIQHCPTNGDPAYDLKRRSQQRADTGALSASPVLPQTNNLVVKEADPPPELRCSLCQGIFKEAVMIPCCQYSFCETCIREYLLEKSLCPQCGSDKSKNCDLLPNVALRQAIDRFRSAQLDTDIPNEGADVESASKAAKEGLSPPTQLNKMSSTARDLSSAVVVDNQHDLPVADDSVCESAIGSKEKVVYEDNKSIAVVGETSSVGRKKKKLSSRPLLISEMVSEHMTGKCRKPNKLCFACGSPDHIARNCTVNAVDNSVCFPTQHGVFRPFGPVPQSIHPFGQEMYWPGPMTTYGAPPALPVGPYGPVPYGSSALSVGHYGVSPFTPMYPNPQMRGFLEGIPHGMSPRERPLSREEFMELQELERRQRLTKEQRKRELLEERSLSVIGSEQSVSSESEHGFHRQWPLANKLQGTFWRHDVDSSFSKEMGSTRIKQRHDRKLANERVDEQLALQQYNNETDEDSPFDDSRGLLLYRKRFQQGVKPILSVAKKTAKIYECPSDSDWEEGQNAKLWGLREEGQSRLSKQTTLARFDDAPFERRELKSYVKHDGTRVSEAGAAEMLRSSRHRSRKAALEVARELHSDQLIQIAAEAKDRHAHHGLVSDDGYSIEMLKKSSSQKHHHHAQTDMIDNISGEGTEKKKKRRKHRKLNVGRLVDVTTGSVLLEVSHKKSSKRHKSRHTSSSMLDETRVELTPVVDDIEESRWQMDDGLGDELMEEIDPPKCKHHRSSRFAL